MTKKGGLGIEIILSYFNHNKEKLFLMCYEYTDQPIQYLTGAFDSYILSKKLIVIPPF